MRLSRWLRHLLVALVVIALICVGVMAGAPIVARQATLHYLTQAGLDAKIGNVDVNLFTGAIAYDDIRGRSESGAGFEIRHLAASLNYRPLLSKQISLSQQGNRTYISPPSSAL
jgi:autotransporter translocation and assembly factor TamB